MAKFLIIGAGISGCTAGLELANQGNDVEIVEATGTIGGKIPGYSCKATDNCSRCGVCIAHIQFKESVQHENIRFTMGASVESVFQEDGKTEVTITRANPNINLKKCINCDICLQVCPNQCITKYSRAEFYQYIVDYSRCLLHQGKECTVCADACPGSAIFSGQKETETKILSDGVLIAAGHEPYDASENILYGYSRIPDVITGVEAEEILSGQNYLSKPDESVAFIQCVGSRNPSIGRNYCSGVCCAYALRIARVLKYRNPGAEITIYYIDIQNFDKTFTLLREELIKSGICFVRGLPFIVEKSERGRLKLLIEDNNGNNTSAEHDTVVLSVGLGPGNNAESLADLFKLKKDEFGFYLPAGSSLKNVFVSGTCREPQSIVESIAQAKSEVLEMMKTIEQKKSVNKTVSATKSEIPASSSTPPLEVINIPLGRNVLIVGGGIAGFYSASEVNNLGYNTTLLSSEDIIADKEMLKGVTVFTGSYLKELKGHAGSFEAVFNTSEGDKTQTFGAVVLTSENADINITDLKDNPLFNSSFIVPMEKIDAAVSSMYRRKGLQPIGLVLDIKIDETKGEMETVLKIGLKLQETGFLQVHIFCRDVRVSAIGMEKLYDEAREAGVNIIKFEGELLLKDDECGVSISCMDSVLQKEISVDCDLIGISMHGINSAACPVLAQITGVSTDAFGQMQDNNIHLFSCKTNRPGIFVAGPCRGSYYLPQIITESKAAALSVHSLLHKGAMEVELSNAVVDPDKCILCLTCIRSCPFKAMEIDREKGVAKSIPEACQKCGICAGECPAKAIELPVFSDQVLLDQINSA
jgi:heterodisulfide reductase subunit A-like polyferredoxin